MKEDENSSSPTDFSDDSSVTTGIRSLKELIDLVSGRTVSSHLPQEESGRAEALPFPFLGIVAQLEMKLALLLGIINPAIGGVLLIGPRGTGKTTAVRSLLNLLPDVKRSTCYYGCTEEDIEAGGIDAVCPECAQKYAEGLPLTKNDPVRLVELPLNAQLPDVIGSIDDQIDLHERRRLKRGILAQADLNVLFVDEVNLINDEIINVILDASAGGRFVIKRGDLRATYNARFSLVGSMNPEEGNIRSQILDRFGLRVIVRGLNDVSDRLEAYQRVRLYQNNPHLLIRQYEMDTNLARQEVISARERLKNVHLPEPVAHKAIQLIRHLNIDSLRAEITFLEAVRAYCAADGRDSVTMNDIQQVAPMALRLRHSHFMDSYFNERDLEDQKLQNTMTDVFSQTDPQKE
ncbi:MAG: ATP-binding protein [Anaerolineae bacterium]|nr:ATP-binding protein [Anaerolineae bacterium]